jgi:hypothetical protein
MSLRYFTVAEANALLPHIEPLVGTILEIRESIIKQQPDLWPVLQKAVGNGGSRIAGEVANQFRLLEECVRSIQDMGVLVKDVNVGLVDFPSFREGREVYLCWRYGEQEVGFWHSLDTGYRGRRSL